MSILNGRLVIQEGELHRILIPLLHLKLRKVERTQINPRRRTRLHTTKGNSHIGELLGQVRGGTFPYPSSFNRLTSDKQFAIEEGSSRQNKLWSLKNYAQGCSDLKNMRRILSYRNHQILPNA